MKIKILALVMLSAVLSFAQTFTQTKPDPSQSQAPEAAAPAETKAGCPCCQKSADSKDAKGCCQHHAAAKDGQTCCSGKDGMACMKGDKDKSDACCSSGKCSASEGKAGCCSKSDKTTEQTAMACCGGGANHCAMGHHDHAGME